MRSFLLVTLGSLFIACGGTTTNGNPTAGDACAQYGAALQSFQERCGDGLTAARSATLAARLRAACASALTLPGTGVTPSVVAGCAAALDTLACNARLSDVAACEAPAGTLSDGAACASSEQCSSRTCTISSSSGMPLPTCGVCKARVPVGGDCGSGTACVDHATCDLTSKKCVAIVRNGLGGSCDASKGEGCQTDLMCDFATKTCKAKGAPGEACRLSTECQAGLACDYAGGICIQPKVGAEGDVCSINGVRCGAGLLCEPTTHKCAKFALVDPGGSCSATAPCARGSCDPTTKKCPTIIADGQPCTSDHSKGVCDDLASCIGGTCQLPGGAVCK